MSTPSGRQVTTTPGESGNGVITSTTNWASFSEIAFAFRVTPQLLLAGLVFSVVMGVVGGFFPARRASKMPVIQALR